MRSGEYGGRNDTRTPAFARMSMIASWWWTEALSMITNELGAGYAFRCGSRSCVNQCNIADLLVTVSPLPLPVSWSSARHASVMKPPRLHAHSRLRL